MPSLCVEYAKSARAKCSGPGCGKKIEKNELRIGSEVTMPFGDDGVTTWKWRHLCCFTERQLANAKSDDAINSIAGEDDLAPTDKALLQKMKEGKLVGDHSILGRIGDVANSSAPPPAAKGSAKAKTTASATPGQKRPRASKESKRDDDVDSEATDEYEVEVTAVSGKPKCPYGSSCFRTNPEHFAEFCHDGDAATATATDASGAAKVLKPVLKGKKAKK